MLAGVCDNNTAGFQIKCKSDSQLRHFSLCRFRNQKSESSNKVNDLFGLMYNQILDSINEDIDKNQYQKCICK